MKHIKRMVALSIIPLLTALLVTFILIFNIIKDDIARRTAEVREQQKQIIVNELQGRIETAYSFIVYCYENNIPKEECKKIIGSIRFDQGNYIWIHRLDPEDLHYAYMLVHAEEKIQDVNITGLIDFDKIEKIYYRGGIYDKDAPEIADLKPKELFLDFNIVATKKGSGVVEYYWPKIHNGQASEIGYLKMSYVKYFAPWNWVIGAGAYADYVDTHVIEQENEIQRKSAHLLQLILILFAVVGTFVSVLAVFVSKRFAVNLGMYENKMHESQRKLQDSEERLYDIAFSSGDLIWEMDMKAVFKFMAGDVERVLEYTENEIIGKTPFDFMPEDEVKDKRAEYEKCFRRSIPILQLENRYLTKSKEEKILLTNGVPVFSKTGELKGYRGIDRDITHEKQEEIKHKIMERELHQAQKLEAIGTLAAGIAHEINTPSQFIGDNLRFLSESMSDLFAYLHALKNIVYSSDLQKDTQLVTKIEENEKKSDVDFLEKEVPLAIEQSLEGILQIGRIVSAMKDFSHLGDGTKQKADLNKAVESASVISHNEWKYVAEMKLELDKNLPPVDCFLGEIKQVVLNLIVNAAHAIKDALAERNTERGLITIRSFVQNGYACVSVEDTGTGIPDDIRDRVFEHFFTTKEVGKGTGQGLSMAYQIIVEKHQGKLYFETKKDRGTTFYLCLPLENE